MTSQESTMPPRHQSDREIRDQYRQSVLELCHEFSSSELAWDVSQHILDEMWNSTENTTTKNKSSIGANSSIVSPESSSNSSTATTIAYACQSCGYRLHPGWNGTTLRVKRPNPFSSPAAKRTLKRREHRKRKKAALAEERKAKDHRHNKRGLSRTDDSEGASPRQKLVLLRDDPRISRLEKHLLVVTCGKCKDKTHLKGLRREQQQQQQKPQQKQTPKRNQATRTTPSNDGDLSENFERLPELGKKKPPPSSSNATKKTPRLSLLEQRMGRKTKKKKGGPNNNQSGNLLNFLSSLNDH